MAISHWFYKCFVNIDVFEKRSLQDAFLAELDPIRAPKRPPKGAQDEPKTDPRRVQNRVQNRSEKMIEKWIAQGSMPRFDPHTFGPQVPTGGVRGGTTKQPKNPYLRSDTPWAVGPANFHAAREGRTKRQNKQRLGRSAKSMGRKRAWAPGRSLVSGRCLV